MSIDAENVEDQSDGWLGRKTRAENFTKIIQSNTDPRVISIEGGFGYGKSVFAVNWAKMLSDEGETVIQFDAWATDHTDDPLVAFVGKLLEAMPAKSPDKWSERRKHATKGLVGFAQIVAVSGAKIVGGNHLADEAADWVGASDGSDDKKVLEEIGKVVAGEATKMTFGLLSAQMAMEKARRTDLPKQLTALREELEAEKPGNERKGRVIVIIDELDRCRPDYAISLLESIKHLFRQQGYVFVLMMNEGQLTRTAERLFGKVGDGEEPYLSKFIDLRLGLGEPDYDELAKLLVTPLRGRFTPLTDAPEMSAESAAIEFARVSRELKIKPRQMKAAVRRVETALALAQGEKVDLAWLLNNSLKIVNNYSTDGVQRSEKVYFDPPWWRASKEFKSRYESLIKTLNLSNRNSLSQKSRMQLHEQKEEMVRKFGPLLTPLTEVDISRQPQMLDHKKILSLIELLDELVERVVKIEMQGLLEMSRELSFASDSRSE